MLTYTSVALFSSDHESIFRVQTKRTHYNVTVGKDEVVILAPGLEEHQDKDDLPEDLSDEALALIAVAIWENAND